MWGLTGFAGPAEDTGRFSEDHLLRRTNSSVADVQDDASSLRAANERLLAMGGLRARPTPVEMMRQALDEPEPDVEPAPKTPFVAAPALPLEEDSVPTFVVKPSEGRAGRRAMDDLREQALRHVIANAQGPAPRIPARAGRGGMLSPSRIILLSVALIAGGVAAYLAAQLNTPAPAPVPEVQVVAAPTTKVLVAKDVIGVGQRVTASTVEWADWPDAALRDDFVTSVASPDAIAEMEGSVARSEIVPGEPILARKLAEPGGGYLASVLESGKRGVSVPVTSASAAGGFIKPNDRVDVVATRTLIDRRVSETILRNVRVLAINGRLAEENGGEPPVSDDAGGTAGGNDSLLATLELDTPQSELVINAMSEGQLTLVLRPFADASEGISAEQAANQSIRASSPFWTK